MGTSTRPEVSKKNPWYINRHRYYELKHFCLQYSEFRKNGKDDWRVKMIQRAAKETHETLCKYIILAVTRGTSFESLRTKYGLPCSNDMYYPLYRKFFWLLDQMRDKEAWNEGD